HAGAPRALAGPPVPGPVVVGGGGGMRSGTRGGVLIPCVSVAGMLVLRYLLGAAVVHFRLPTADYLHDAFTGGQAWWERSEALATAPDRPERPTPGDVDEPGKTFDGFTLYTTNVGSQASLINMRGEEVHRWEAPFSRVWPAPP